MTCREQLVVDVLTNRSGCTAAVIARIVNRSSADVVVSVDDAKATVYRMHRAGKLRVVGLAATGGRPARRYALPTEDR